MRFLGERGGQCFRRASFSFWERELGEEGGEEEEGRGGEEGEGEGEGEEGG